MNILENAHTDAMDYAETGSCLTDIDEHGLRNLMYDDSEGMLMDTVVSLAIEKDQKILELGPGRTKHLPMVLSQAPGLRYVGLDTSQMFIDRARETVTREEHAVFTRYNGLHVPYASGSFDRILTVNTIYFWQKPKSFLKELYRVLTPNGICVVTFMEGAFMKNLSFVNDSFQLYDINKFVSILVESGFENVDIRTRNECIQNEKGPVADKVFLVATLQKASKNDTNTKKKEYHTITN